MNQLSFFEITLKSLQSKWGLIYKQFIVYFHFLNLCPHLAASFEAIACAASQVTALLYELGQSFYVTKLIRNLYFFKKLLLNIK
jgi:hypothetical protein